MRKFYLTWGRPQFSVLGSQFSESGRKSLSRPSAVGLKQDVASYVSTTVRSPQHDCYPLARCDVLAVWGDDDVAIGAGASCDVAGALPGDKLCVRVFVFSGKNCGEESGQAGLDADVGFQAGVRECEWVGRHSCESLEHRFREQLEGDHGGDWVAGEAEEIF